ncbi:hypothetical protein OG206_01365 [Streptomyces sp. NBC_01341]|uniref:hypothetical protein n=1 Tax=Streptomyces sp. NBC_01341 TaxID=2903831 RepID=UPI002E160F81|nr:hypothetical protein OG206_01365 [Streptomyces sp. NBC_01341]
MLRHAVGAGAGAPEPTRYRLVVEAANDNPVFGPYSTATRTEWSFVSGEAEQQTLPLVQLDYDVDQDADGKARRNAAVDITPSVPGAPDREVSSLGLEVSCDGGASWHRPKTSRHGGAWEARLSAPASASFVSLRTAAKDDGGGTITQTLVRAYGLR